MEDENIVTNLWYKDVQAKFEENVNHNGVVENLTEIRSQFWIIKGRHAVN